MLTHGGDVDSLDANQIGDAGAQAIAEALKVNTTLTWLKLVSHFDWCM